MNEKEKLKFGRLTEIFERNFKVTRLYADYLERYPELITKEMIDTLTEDGEISKNEALVAILSEIFALDFENPDDRIIIRDYLTPSVRILDSEKYKNNPYYKKIKINDLKSGTWELKTECYPAYRGVISGDMIIKDDFSEIPPLGFFTEDFHFPAVLENGNEWMTLTPVDLDTCEDAIERARGRVVTFGLGLGYYAYMASEKEEVESVTVVELSPEVIKLFEENILPQMEHREKIRIVCADAFEYAENVMPKEKFDVAFVDTWRDASDGAPMYRKMKALEHLSKGTEFLYWIENFLISRIRAERFSDIYEKIEDGTKDAPESCEEIIKALSEI